VTVFESLPVPPEPVHVTVYTVVTRGETDTPGDVLLMAPLVEKFVPVHEVAFDDDHVRMELWPLVMEYEDAVRRTTGTGLETVTVYEVQPDWLLFTSSARALNVCAPVVLHE
jgi:hypothetical protein